VEKFAKFNGALFLKREQIGGIYHQKPDFGGINGLKNGTVWPSVKPDAWPSRVDARNGVGTNFGVGVEEARPEGPRAGNGVLGEGTASPSTPTRGLRERCKLSQRGSGRSPGRRRVFLYSESSDCPSHHLSTCCIQFAWLGIRFF